MTSTDAVQIVSLPLEIVGLSLTIIENFFRERNALLETKFHRWTFELEKFFTSGSRISPLLFAAPFVGLAIVVYLTGERTTEINPWQYDTYFLTFFACFYGYYVNRVLVVFLPERRLLAFAITLSAIGLLGEIYQVSKIDF